MYNRCFLPYFKRLYTFLCSEFVYYIKATWLFLEQEDHLGWGHRAESRWRAGPLRWWERATIETWSDTPEVSFMIIDVWRPIERSDWLTLNLHWALIDSPEDIETDGSVWVDVGMIDLSCEGDLWWLKGVIWNTICTVQVCTEPVFSHLWESE